MKMNRQQLLDLFEPYLEDEEQVAHVALGFRVRFMVGGLIGGLMGLMTSILGVEPVILQSFIVVVPVALLFPLLKHNFVLGFTADRVVVLQVGTVKLLSVKNAKSYPIRILAEAGTGLRLGSWSAKLTLKSPNETLGLTLPYAGFEGARDDIAAAAKVLSAPSSACQAA